MKMIRSIQATKKLLMQPETRFGLGGLLGRIIANCLVIELFFPHSHIRPMRSTNAVSLDR